MMTTSKPLLLAGLLVLGLLGLPSAEAAEPGSQSTSPPTSPPTSQWGLGATVGFDRKPYRDFDDEAQVLPLILYENRWVRVAGPMADLKLSSSDSLSLALRLRFSGEGYEAEDSPYLLGMAERKASFWAGGAASWRTGWATLSAEALGDASGNSKGTRLSLGIERSFGAGDFSLTPRLAVHRLDRKYVDYYYGVRAEEAAPLRPVYAGGSATNVEAGLRLGHALAPRQRLSLDLSTTRLGSGIKASPLVERTRQDGTRVSYLYLF